MRVGNRVKLIGVPNDLPEQPDLPAKAVFAKCPGHEFIMLASTTSEWQNSSWNP